MSPVSQDPSRSSAQAFSDEATLCMIIQLPGDIDINEVILVIGVESGVEVIRGYPVHNSRLVAIARGVSLAVGDRVRLLIANLYHIVSE